MNTYNLLLAMILMGFPCLTVVSIVWLTNRHNEIKQGLREPRDRRG